MPPLGWRRSAIFTVIVNSSRSIDLTLGRYFVLAHNSYASSNFFPTMKTHFQLRANFFFFQKGSIQAWQRDKSLGEGGGHWYKYEINVLSIVFHNYELECIILFMKCANNVYLKTYCKLNEILRMLIFNLLINTYCIVNVKMKLKEPFL